MVDENVGVDVDGEECGDEECVEEYGEGAEYVDERASAEPERWHEFLLGGRVDAEQAGGCGPWRE